MRQHGFLRRWKKQTAFWRVRFGRRSGRNGIFLPCDFRPPAATGIHFTQGHAAPGEDLQGDRHPEETGPSQRGEAGGGQSDESARSCCVHLQCLPMKRIYTMGIDKQLLVQRVQNRLKYPNALQVLDDPAEDGLHMGESQSSLMLSSHCVHMQCLDSSLCFAYLLASL